MAKSVIKVGGMSCEHCVKAVNDAISALAGVSGVKVSLKAGTATVKYDEAKVTLEAIHVAIKGVEYEVIL
ncbi:MAG: copper ion binding protein [Oscillospiraceae bacterium]|jgi:copper chaperone|nr:copper ion binding protein [Oscillospiraceae bacterium]